MKRRPGGGARRGEGNSDEGGDDAGQRGSSKGRKKRPAQGGARRPTPGVCPYCGHEEFEQLVIEKSVAGIVTESHHLDYADCGRCKKKFNWKTGKPHQGTVDALTYGGVAFLVLVVVVFLLTRKH